MKIKVITSYKPGTWNEYAKRAVDSVLEHWPANTDVVVYHESQTQDAKKRLISMECCKIF